MSLSLELKDRRADKVLATASVQDGRLVKSANFPNIAGIFVGYHPTTKKPLEPSDGDQYIIGLARTLDGSYTASVIRDETGQALSMTQAKKVAA